MNDKRVARLFKLYCANRATMDQSIVQRGGNSCGILVAGDDAALRFQIADAICDRIALRLRHPDRWFERSEVVVERDRRLRNLGNRALRRLCAWTHVVREHGGSEFARRGCGHPPHWARDGVHGCDGGCQHPSFPGRKPAIGDLAVCGAGQVGMIAQVEKRHVQYPDGNEAMAYVGASMMEKIGQWSSRNPCIIGTIQEYMVSDENLYEYVTARAVRDWPLDKESLR